MVGKLDGDSVGRWVGDFDLDWNFTLGNLVGLATGDLVSVGALVGFAVGELLGTGLFVGEGFFVGAGFLVGDLTGERVGVSSFEEDDGGREATLMQFLPCQTQTVVFVQVMKDVSSAQSTVGAMVGIVGDNDVGRAVGRAVTLLCCASATSTHSCNQTIPTTINNTYICNSILIRIAQRTRTEDLLSLCARLLLVYIF